ncbi:preprotein translocase subunit SecG [Hyphomonas sp.]|uniref:preprotein translocase subunit SecG n=1 Tax=Hyphomonas sp. TaxID=87 RepID=UPI003529C2D5
MQNVILVIHILACLVMIGLVLVQKSEGGGLGIGGGGGGTNSLLSGRGAAGAVVRSTIIFGAIFFITSLALTTLANREGDNRSDIERVLAPEDSAPAPGTPTDLFDPSAPLLSGQAGLSDASVAAPESAADATEGEGEAAAEPEPEVTAPESGNPQ